MLPATSSAWRNRLIGIVNVWKKLYLKRASCSTDHRHINRARTNGVHPDLVICSFGRMVDQACSHRRCKWLSLHCFDRSGKGLTGYGGNMKGLVEDLLANIG